MKIHTAEYVKSCVLIEQCPTEYAEYAFIGRSNVGKSSLINMLTNRKNLAKISSKPGKTQTINYFRINYTWYLVDLPGYGYAKTSKVQRAKFDKIIKNYILRSPNLMTLFVLIDISIPPQKIDLQFIYEFGMNEIPLIILFTKSDKVKKSALEKNIGDFKNAMLETWEELPKMIVTSAKTKTGRDEILDYIDDVNKLFKR